MSRAICAGRKAGLLYQNRVTLNYLAEMIQDAAGEPGARVQLCDSESTISEVYLSSIFYKLGLLKKIAKRSIY